VDERRVLMPHLAESSEAPLWREEILMTHCSEPMREGEKKLANLPHAAGTFDIFGATN
jgi:hypothetical protein